MLDYSTLPSLFNFRSTNTSFSDLHIISIGFCDFTRYKDVLRVMKHKHHTIHFILEGEGTYKVDKQEFKLTKKHAFYTPPQKTLSYYPNPDKPWIYVWFAFEGEKAQSYISQYSITQNYVAKPSNADEIVKLLDRLLSTPNPIPTREETILVTFFKFIELLSHDDIQSSKKAIDPATYVQLAKDIIYSNYTNPHFNIQQVAQAIHISHSYLCFIFKKHAGYSAKHFLSHCRLNQAKDFLIYTQKSITQISAYCGFSDPLYFSSAFKKYFGLSPSEYHEKYYESDTAYAATLSSKDNDSLQD